MKSFIALVRLNEVIHNHQFIQYVLSSSSETTWTREDNVAYMACARHYGIMKGSVLQRILYRSPMAARGQPNLANSVPIKPDVFFSQYRLSYIDRKLLTRAIQISRPVLTRI